MAPFIKMGALRRLLDYRPREVRVITRFNLNDFADRVSDLDALKALLTAGARVRGVKHLHSKLYVFGRSSAVVTSANLTQAALDRNEEFGSVLTGAADIQSCTAYFDQMRNRSGEDLTRAQMAHWTTILKEHRARDCWRSGEYALGDFGADLARGRASPVEGLAAERPGGGSLIVIPDRTPAYVKLMGEATNRASLTLTLSE